jgi:competence protein ComEC
VSVVAVAANLVVAPVVAPVTVLGTAAATLSVCWAGAAELLIRFSGPELWWVSSVTRWAAATPGATVAVPVGVPGVMVVVAAGIVAGLIWRTRWRRAAIGATLICVLAWSIADVSGVRGTIVG